MESGRPGERPSPPAVYYVLADYGWYLLLGVALAVLVWAQAGPKIRAWLKRLEERREEQNYGEWEVGREGGREGGDMWMVVPFSSPDPVRAERHQDAMMRAREKMQRELDEKALECQERLEAVS